VCVETTFVNMCVCMYVCMYVCMQVCMYVYTYMFAYECIYILKPTVFMCTCAYVCTGDLTYVHVQKIRVCFVCVCVCSILVHIHTCIHTYRRSMEHQSMKTQFESEMACMRMDSEEAKHRLTVEVTSLSERLTYAVKQCEDLKEREKFAREDAERYMEKLKNEREECDRLSGAVRELERANRELQVCCIYCMYVCVH
jgi:hypothetical protein